MYEGFPNILEQVKTKGVAKSTPISVFLPSIYNRYMGQPRVSIGLQWIHNMHFHEGTNIGLSTAHWLCIHNTHDLIIFAFLQCDNVWLKHTQDWVRPTSFGRPGCHEREGDRFHETSFVRLGCKVRSCLHNHAIMFPLLFGDNFEPVVFEGKKKTMFFGEFLRWAVTEVILRGRQLKNISGAAHCTLASSFDMQWWPCFISSLLCCRKMGAAAIEMQKQHHWNEYFPRWLFLEMKDSYLTFHYFKLFSFFFFWI